MTLGSTGWSDGRAFLFLGLAIGLVAIAEFGLLLYMRGRHARSTASLARYEKLCSQIVDATPNAVLIVRHEEIVLANPSAARILGAESVAALVGLPLSRFLSPSGAEQLLPQIGAAIRGVHLQPAIDLSLAGLGGEARLVQARVEPFDFESQPAAFLLCRDLTEENRSRERIEQLTKLFEECPDVMALTSVDARILFVNRAGREFLGLDSLSEPYPRIDEVVAWERPDEAPERRDRLRRGESLLFETNVLHRPSGEMVPAEFHSFPIHSESSGEVIALATVVRDLRPKQAVANQLRDRIEFQELVFGISSMLMGLRGDEILQGVREALSRIGRFSGAQRAFVASLEAERPDFHPRYVWNANESPPPPPIPRERELPLWMHRLRRLETVRLNRLQEMGVEERSEQRAMAACGVRSALLVPVMAHHRAAVVIGIFSTDGERFWSPAIEAALQKVGEVIAGALHRREVESELRGYSEALEALVRHRTARIEQLERQRLEGEKLAATGRMSARIAHEINNPLAGIKNSFRLIRDAVPASHPHARYIERIDREIDRIARIVKQMYDIYRPEKEKPRRFSVSELLRDVVALLEPHWQKQQLSIELLCEPGELELDLPESSLRQVLFNLMANAIEASPAHGTILVSAMVHTASVRLEVADQGGGIPDWAVEQVFEPFFTTKHTSDGSGLGLGLSISRGLVEAMGGTITFECVPARGTTFRIDLPQADAMPEAASS